jgi:hypothetical protein
MDQDWVDLLVFGHRSTASQGWPLIVLLRERRYTSKSQKPATSIRSGHRDRGERVMSEASHGRQVAAEAERIVDNTRHTRYQYPPYVIDDQTGTYDVDCCGFVSYVLDCVAPEHYKLIGAAANWPVPQAFKYYEFIDSLPTTGTVGWRRIYRLADSRPGDIIAWLLRQTVGDTGHVFIVAGDPEVVTADQSAVRAYDSSDILHYDDSRQLADGQQETGVGTGTIQFQIDQATGRPTAFQFGPGDCFHSVPIAIGRLEPIARFG